MEQNDVVEQRVQPARTCPRCNSDDTKFCYFNNYSLSQPRYFCKGCRRYWTHGGSLRNVPVGGSSRKFKRRPRHFLPSPPPAPPVVGPSSAVAPASCYFPLGLFSSLVAMQSMNQTSGSGFEFGSRLMGGHNIWNEQKPFVSTSGFLPPVTGPAAGGGGDSCLRLDQWPEFLPGGDRN